MAEMLKESMIATTMVPIAESAQHRHTSWTHLDVRVEFTKSADSALLCSLKCGASASSSTGGHLLPHLGVLRCPLCSRSPSLCHEASQGRVSFRRTVGARHVDRLQGFVEVRHAQDQPNHFDSA